MSCSNNNDRLVYIYYTRITATLDQTRVASAPASDANWPGSLILHGTALTPVHPLLDDLEPYRDGWPQEAERVDQAA